MQHTTTAEPQNYYALEALIFCVSTFPEIEEYKISVPRTFNKEIKKLLFLPSKMGVDLYTGKYGTSIVSAFKFFFVKPLAKQHSVKTLGLKFTKLQLNFHILNCHKIAIGFAF